MTAKEYLSRIRKFDMVIQNKLAEYQQINSMVYSVSVPVAGDKVQTSGGSDKMSNAVVKMVDIEKSLEYFISERSKIVSQIEAVGDVDLYDVLAKRYILGLSNKEIAYEKKTEERTVTNLLKEAHDEFEKLFLTFP